MSNIIGLLIDSVSKSATCFSSFSSCFADLSYPVLVSQDGGRGEWKVVTGGGQAELSQDGRTPSFVTSPVVLLRTWQWICSTGSVCPASPAPMPPLSFCPQPSPTTKCFFAVHSVLYYCQITIPKVKIRSHQLGQTSFMVCGIWIFPWCDPKSLSGLVLCRRFPTLKTGRAVAIVVILPVVLILLPVVKQQQYRGSQWSQNTVCWAPF